MLSTLYKNYKNDPKYEKNYEQLKIQITLLYSESKNSKCLAKRDIGSKGKKCSSYN